MVNSPPSSGASPSTRVKPERLESSIQPKASRGGPVSGISSPSPLIGRMLFSAWTTGAAKTTPLMEATSPSSDSSSTSGWPNSSTGRSSKSVPLTISLESALKLERRPSVRTNDETTNDTARTTAKVVRANRSRLATRFLMVKRNMSLFPVVSSAFSDPDRACGPAPSWGWGRPSHRRCGRRSERRLGRRRRR